MRASVCGFLPLCPLKMLIALPFAHSLARSAQDGAPILPTYWPGGYVTTTRSARRIVLRLPLLPALRAAPHDVDARDERGSDLRKLHAQCVETDTLRHLGRKELLDCEHRIPRSFHGLSHLFAHNPRLLRPRAHFRQSTSRRFRLCAGAASEPLNSGAHRDQDAPDDEPTLRHDGVSERSQLGGSVRHLHVSSDGARRLPRVLLGAATGGEGVSSHVEGNSAGILAQVGKPRLVSAACSVSIFANIGIDHFLCFLDVSGATSSQPAGKPIKTLTHAGLRRPAVAPGIAASLRLDRTSRPFAPVGPRSSRLCGVGHATISFRFEIPGGPPPLRGFARARISAICSGVFAPTAS